MEEDLKILEKYIKEQKEFAKQFNLEEIEDGTEGQRRLQAIENLIARNKELEENIEFIKKNIKENGYIPKSKVREIIQKYYDEYEKEKEYRYTGDVDEEQRILRKIEKELLQEGDK